MKKIEECLNEIMSTSHQMVDILVRKARLQANGNYERTEEYLDKKIVKNKRKRLIELYYELSELMEEWEDKTTDTLIEVSQLPEDIARDEAKDEVREAIDDYINISYQEMQFMPDEERELESIYQGTDQEAIRSVEYLCYEKNIDVIELYQEIRERNLNQLNYGQKAQILESLTNYKAFEKSSTILGKVIKELQKNDSKFEFKSKAQKQGMLEFLSMYKAVEDYKRINEYDNGILMKDVEALKYINLESDGGEIQLLFGISSEDYDRKVTQMVHNYLERVKLQIKANLRATVKPKKRMINEHANSQKQARLKTLEKKGEKNKDKDPQK